MRDMLYDGNPALEPGCVPGRAVVYPFRQWNTAQRGDLGLLAQLVDFTIARDYPELQGDTAANAPMVCGSVPSHRL